MIKELGGRHSSMVLSAPTILWPQVRIRSTPSILCSIFIVEIKTLSDNWDKDENNEKEAGIGPYWKMIKENI